MIRFGHWEKPTKRSRLIRKLSTGSWKNAVKFKSTFYPQLPHCPIGILRSFFSRRDGFPATFTMLSCCPGGYTGLVIGDVCDKGVGSALFMALFRSLIRIFAGQAQLSRSLIDTKSQTVGGTLDSASIRKYDQVEAIRAVALTNDYIAQEHNEMCMFATLFFGVLDPKNGRLIYVSGGHETVFVIDQNGIRESLLPTGPAVGLQPSGAIQI